jgi:ATP-binding cassette subfamily B protein
MKSEKPKNIRKTSKRLVGDFRTQVPPFIIVGILLIISAALSIITPVILRNVLNDPSNYFTFDIATSTLLLNYSELFKAFGLMLLLYTGAAILSWLADFIVIKISAIFAYEMRKRVKNKLDYLPLSYYDRYTYGEILSRGTNDVDNISRNLSNIVNQTIYSIAQFIGVIIAMFIVNWQLSLVTIATLPLTIGIVAVIAVQSQKQFSKYRYQLGILNSIIEECYGGHKIIKLFNKEEDKFEEFDKVNTEMTKSDRMSQWLSGFIFPSMRFVNNLGFVAISVVGGLLTNVGDMVAFFLFLQIFQTPFQNLGQIAGITQSVISSAERIYEVLDEKEFQKDDVDCINSEDSIKGKIEFKNVCFSYLADKPLINNMNISINQGDSIAIVGPTGAGKTTIVNLLMRFYEVNSGEITLDGININHYSRDALRGSIGMVLQDTWLFEGTIKENIRYGREDATDEDIIDAAKSAHAHHFIETLPGGYDFKLNEDGTNISQGQRQLLTIARAIVSKPKILILDEATSNVDTRTEKAIQDAMNKMMVGKTSFIIAHRLSTIKNAKTIIVMKKGSIVEVGNHEELLKANGFYADLYNAQFLGRNPLAPQENNG